MMTTQMVTIYFGRWNDRDYVFSLEREKTQRLISEHFAFGDPLEDEYAVGSKWAVDDGDSGWRIVQQIITIPVIKVDIRSSGNGGTSHAGWECPCCGRSYSDDWQDDDTLPTLLGCGCEISSKYLLGVSASASA